MSNESKEKEILELASKSFGLVVPSHLNREIPFSTFNLDEDALLRIDSVDALEEIVHMRDSDGHVAYATVTDLAKWSEQLHRQWVKLTPTTM